MSIQKAIVQISAIFLLLLIADCSEGTKVLTRNWGPQSTLYLKGKLRSEERTLDLHTSFRYVTQKAIEALDQHKTKQLAFTKREFSNDGKRNMLEMETDFPALRPVYWMNSISSIIGYQKSKPTLEQLFKKIKLSQY